MIMFSVNNQLQKTNAHKPFIIKIMLHADSKQKKRGITSPVLL